MKHDHAKAIAYFQRALKLDRTYISAWTLLGHEFVEQKNVPAAIECYHSATGEEKAATASRWKVS